MSAEHNHPPHCCCFGITCPACPEHGTFACKCDSPNPRPGPWHAVGCCPLYAPVES